MSKNLSWYECRCCRCSAESESLPEGWIELDIKIVVDRICGELTGLLSVVKSSNNISVKWYICESCTESLSIKQLFRKLVKAVGGKEK